MPTVISNGTATNGAATNGNGVHAELQALPRNLQGKTAIVTGSSRGIGAGIALELGKRGANVVVNNASEKSAPAGAAVVKAIVANGNKAVLVQASVVLQEDIKKLINAAIDVSIDGKIDILVHNAGHGDDCYLEDITEDFYTTQTDINLKGPIFLTQAALPHLNKGGRIVIISSVSARMGVPQQTVYAASKAATEALVRVWATELGHKYGVTVNAVAPGPIATEMYYASDQGFLDSMQPLIDSTPAAPRVGEVSDIVPVVAFLCSEESRWTTGTSISASGGLLFM